MNTTILKGDVQIAVLLPDRDLQSQTSYLGFILLYSALGLLVIALLFIVVLLRRVGRRVGGEFERKRYIDLERRFI